MTGVVLRCPKCGTTQGHTGECDACYEDQVRYFCSSHRPGVWLDAPLCHVCGAKFGDVPKPPPAPRAPPPRRVPTPETSRASAPPRPVRPSPAPEPPDIEAPRIERSPLPDPGASPPGITLVDLLARALAARRARDRYRGDEAPWGRRAPDIGDARPRNKGCLLKALLLIVLLLAFVLGGPFVLLSGFLQYFL